MVRSNPVFGNKLYHGMGRMSFAKREEAYNLPTHIFCITTVPVSFAIEKIGGAES